MIDVPLKYATIPEAAGDTALRKKYRYTNGYNAKNTGPG
jgi:hypothetical protein